ncbi:histone deacetylase [Kitasatospora sp. NPDC089913]|uniref:histone deacetylase n=1 Tax=Kitasatospora sp. NPDC089913 TaxID=3364080 RepID=UPI00383078E0
MEDSLPIRPIRPILPIRWPVDPADAADAPGRDGPVWYAAYGSNMHTERLACYLGGGRPADGAREYPGCRDGRPPRRSVPVRLPGSLYFALESRVWGGGMAFYDPYGPGTAPARAHLLTAGQFSDIAAQETGGGPGTDLDLGTVLRTGRDQQGPGRYRTLVCLGTLEGLPVLTVTAPWRLAEAELNAPRARYLRAIAAGLTDAHGWSARRASVYLTTRPGAAGHWTVESLYAALAPHTGGSASATGSGRD